MKKYYVLLAACLFSRLASFEIFSQCPSTEKLGYGDWYIDTDGELVLMQQLLKPGNVVFDVGGNHGEWSSFALQAQPNIQLFTFEPVPPVFEILQKTLENYNQVQLFDCALSDQIGISEFMYYPEADGLSSFYYREVLRGDHPDPQVIYVQQETLDHFCEAHAIQKIDFMKLDTEGSEWRIFKGAENLLKNHQIRAIQFEYGGCNVDSKTTLKQMIAMLTDNAYVIFRIIPTGLILISKWEDSLENYHLSNYFAICEEDLSIFSDTDNLR